MTTNVRAGALTQSAAGRTRRSNAQEATLGSFLAPIKAHLSWVIALSLLLAMVASKEYLLALIDHEITEISVSGELKHVSSGDVSAQVSGWLNSSFLTADLQEIKAQVDSLPWVNNSMVSRVWPGKLTIHTVEERPVALWNGHAYLNAEASVFEPESLAWDAQLPELIAPASSSQESKADMLQRLAELHHLLGPHNLVLKSLTASERGVWELGLESGLQVALGSPPFEQKIERLAAVLTGATEETRGRMLAVDTRYPNGLAIKWKEPTSAK